MRWTQLAAATLLLGTIGGARAEDGPYRHFTRPAIDPNRNDRIIYVPVALGYTEGPRPGMPHDVSAATWYLEPLGSREAKPDKVLDDARYVLERFETVRVGGRPMLEVVITRYPAPAAGTDVPLLRVVEPESNISAAATATVSAIPGGVRYRFLVEPPLRNFAPEGDPGMVPATDRYSLLFMPARDVKYPAAMRQLGTFAGASVETRMQQGPPQLPVQERVAGKRLEFRNTRSAGRVVYTEKVAGKRQEIRNRK